MRVSLLCRLHDALACGDALCVQIKAPADTSEEIDIHGQICIQVTYKFLCSRVDMIRSDFLFQFGMGRELTRKAEMLKQEMKTMEV